MAASMARGFFLQHVALLLAAFAACVQPRFVQGAPPLAGGGGEEQDTCDPACGQATALGLLQRESGRHHWKRAADSPAAAAPTAGGGAKQEIVLSHIPYNFGHTTEKVAAFGSGPVAQSKFMTTEVMLSSTRDTPRQWRRVQSVVMPGGEIWGHLNPDLQQTSEVTGCPLYYTPGKYWPKDIAQAYFGNKTIFGMLRDPYERLVALFRGNFGDYGGSYPEFIGTCDVNGAVKQMMADYMAGDIYAHECTFLPQAEYFDEPFGIAEAVDNRRYPDSLNEFFAAHGYTDLHVDTKDVLHVHLCQDAWAGDLDCETKALVKQVYARDFDLLCKHFGYCDREENCCIEPTPGMCPTNLEERRKTATYCAGAQ